MSNAIYLYGTAGMRKRSIITLGVIAVPGAIGTVALTLVIPPQKASAAVSYTHLTLPTNREV